MENRNLVRNSIIVLVLVLLAVPAFGGDYVRKRLEIKSLGEDSVYLQNNAGVLEGSEDGGSTYSPLLFSSDINTAGGPMLYMAPLSLYGAISPSSDVQSILGAADVAAVNTLLGTGQVTQDTVTLSDEDEITPVAGDVVFIPCDPQSDPTNFTISESGATDGKVIIIYNSSTTLNMQIADNAGVTELDGTIVINPGGFLTLRYVTAAYYKYPGGTTEFIGDISIPGGGTIQGDLQLVETAANIYVSGETASDTDYRGGMIVPTGACDIIFQQQDSVAGVYVDVFMDTTGDVFVYSNESGITHTLLNGTDTGNSGSNRFQVTGTVGNLARIAFTDATTLRVLSGTVTDGVAAGASCALYDYYPSSGTGANSQTVGQYSTSPYAGNILTAEASGTLCEFSLRCSSITGTIDGARDYTLQLWELDGNDLDTTTGVLAESAVIDGGDIVSSDYISGSMGTPYAYTNGTSYAFVLRSSDDGSTTPSEDGSNYIGLTYSNACCTGGTTTLANGHFTIERKARWQADGTLQDSDTTDAFDIRILTQ